MDILPNELYIMIFDYLEMDDVKVFIDEVLSLHNNSLLLKQWCVHKIQKKMMKQKIELKLPLR